MSREIVNAKSEETVENGFKSDIVFKEIEQKLEKERESLIKKFKAVYCFELSGGPGGKSGVWFVDVKKDGVIYRGKTSDLKADCTIKMTDENCFKMMTGQLNPQSAFLQGKVKVLGNMGLAMKLQQLKVSNLKSKM